jgi:hypothetical protein
MTKRPNYVHRASPKTSLDDIPTPPWATRTLIKFVLPALGIKRPKSAYDPAVGRGHIWSTLFDCGSQVYGSDVKDYGSGFPVVDWTKDESSAEDFDWLITNPLYKLSEWFFHRAYSEAQVGVALLVRTLWAEGIGRYERIFSKTPPTCEAIFTRRIPFAKGRVVQKKSMFISHSWLVWHKRTINKPTVRLWIPPTAQVQYEKPEDYDARS